jgi:hypothetical protein
MNDDAQLIKAALERRFARASVPACPEGAWRVATTIARRRGVPRGFAYAAALLAVVAIAGVAAQASSTIHVTYARLMAPFFVSSKPLQPGIHRADRLTIAQAQSRMPFTIVVPTGLPAHTRFVYAHILSEKPTPRVALTYEAHIASKYYRISFDESMVAVGQPRARFEWQSRGHGIQTWTIPMRRFKHGDIAMDMFAWGLPSDLSDRIVRENTM